MDNSPTPPNLGSDYWILMMQETHSDLNLSREQAARLVQKTQFAERVSGSFMSANPLSQLHDGLSTLEEFDYQRSLFAQVLDPEQMDVYTQFFDENYQQHREWIAAKDLDTSKQITVCEQQIAYVQRTLLPALREMRLFVGLRSVDFQERREQLQSEYQTLCDQLLLRDMRGHFRECRTYAPNGMRKLELDNELLRLLPRFDLARFFVRAETVALADALSSEFAGALSETTAANIEAAYDEYAAFCNLGMEALLAESAPGATYIVHEHVEPETVYKSRADRHPPPAIDFVSKGLHRRGMSASLAANVVSEALGK